MRIRNFILISFLIVSLLPVKAQVSTQQLSGGINPITTSVPFLLIAPDSRQGGMGEVGAATQPDVNSIHWNPAKLPFAEKSLGVSISYTPWLRALVNDINLAYLAGYKKIKDDQAILVKGRLELSDDGVAAIIAQDVQQLGLARMIAAKKIIVRSPVEAISQDQLEQADCDGADHV